MELTEREALILSLRHGMTPPASYEFIGEQLKLSKEYVKHLDMKLMHKVRLFAHKKYPVKWEEIR